MSLPAATKLGQGNVFTGVCDSVQRGGCLPQCMLGYHPPPEQTPPQEQTPPGADTPQEQTPLEQTPPGADPPPRADTLGCLLLGGGVCLSACWDTTPPPEQTPPRSRHTPSPRADTPAPEADYGIRSTSGRYASYWNTFLFLTNFHRRLLE